MMFFLGKSFEFVLNLYGFMIKFIRETYYEKNQINIKNLIVSSIDLYTHNEIMGNDVLL